MALDTWSLPAAAELDPGDPVKSEHATKFRGSINHNYGYIGGNNYTPAEDHDHDGTDSKQIAASSLSGSVTQSQIGASAVGQAELKTTQETQSGTLGGTTNSTLNLTFSSVGTYGFFPETNTNGNLVDIHLGCNVSSGAYVVTLGFRRMGTASTETQYGRIRYIQASPPHSLLSDEDHGLWFFVLWDKTADAPVRTWSAMDPPWWLRNYLALGRRGKVDPGRFWLRPHPFVDDVPELPANHEVRLLDLSHLNRLVRYRPAADRLSRFDLRAKPRGVALPTWRAYRDQLAADVADEEAAIVEAETDAAYLEAWAEERRLAILRDTSKSSERQDQLLERLGEIVARRRAAIAPRLGERREVDVLEAAAAARESSLHQDMLAGRIPVLDTCTECLSSKSGPSRLPDLFKGANPTVRVMTRK